MLGDQAQTQGLGRSAGALVVGQMMGDVVDAAQHGRSVSKLAVAVRRRRDRGTPSIAWRCKVCATKPDAFISSTKTESQNAARSHAAWRCHRLLDHHETPGQGRRPAQRAASASSCCPDAGGDIEPLRREVGTTSGEEGAHDPGSFQFARQETGHRRCPARPRPGYRRSTSSFTLSGESARTR